MTLPQLDELLKLRPDLLNHAGVRPRLGDQAPARGRRRLEARPAGRPAAYLDRLQAFVDPLAPVHNALKAHVLFHRLAFDRAEGVYDKDRFLAYLKLPRHQPYMAAALERPRRVPPLPGRPERRLRARPRCCRRSAPTSRSSAATCKHFFARGRLAEGVRAVHRRHVPAAPVRRDEDRERPGRPGGVGVAAAAGPLRAGCKDRVDIDFAFTNKTDFAADEPVAARPVRQERADAAGEGVRDQHRELLPDAAARRWTPTSTWTGWCQRRGVAPVRRAAAAAGGAAVRVPGADEARRVRHRLHRRRQEQPGAGPQGPAAAARRHRHRRADGHAWWTRPNKPVPDATVWLGGQEYTAGQGRRRRSCRSPPQPGRRPVVLSRGDFACLDYIDHQPEDYRLAAGIHVDRETLLTQRVAPVLVRPGLFLNGQPVSVKLLEDVRLRITSADHDGIAVVDRGAGLQAVRGPRVGPRVPRPAAAGGADRHPHGEGEEPEHRTRRWTWRPAETFALNGIDQDGQDRGPAPGEVRAGLRHRTARPDRRGEAGPAGARWRSSTATSRSRCRVTLKTDAARPGHARAAGRHRRPSPRPARRGRRTPGTLPTDRHTYRQVAPREGRRGGHAAVPRRRRAGRRGTNWRCSRCAATGIRADRFDALADQRRHARAARPRRPATTTCG